MNISTMKIPNFDGTAISCQILYQLGQTKLLNNYLFVILTNLSVVYNKTSREFSKKSDLNRKYNIFKKT